MDSERLFRLQQMGLTYWSVRRPQLFTPQDSHAFCSYSRYRALVIVAQPPDVAARKLVRQVLAALDIAEPDYHIITASPLALERDTFSGVLWFAGTDALPSQTGQRMLVSPSLTRLAGSPRDKQALWQQMVAYV